MSPMAGSQAHGIGPRVGHMGFCAQCKNKSEVRLYSGDNPEPICEDCYMSNQQLEAKIGNKEVLALQGQNPAQNYISGSPPPPTDERSIYLDVVSKASPEWVNKFISEIVTKQVLQYDWFTIVKNDRWFSILDLRRFALQVNPEFEKPKEISHARIEPRIEPRPEIVRTSTRPKVRRGRPKADTAGEGANFGPSTRSSSRSEDHQRNSQ